MIPTNFSKKRIIHIFIVIFFVIIMFLIALFFMIKYNVEGEKNIPFILKNINIISTAESDIKQDNEENWHAGILQKNDIFFVIEKNEHYNKEDTIKNIKFENFQILKKNNNADIKIYKPKSNNLDYIYSEEYKIDSELNFEGALETNLEALQIKNQGGTIGFSITQNNLGEYNFSVNEKVPSDGKLLAKLGLGKDDIKFTIAFDLIIETGSEIKYKTNIELELPAGNILKEGVSTHEDTELEGIVFKRVK